MNNGALNAYTLNGAVLDPVVRTHVVARAYAVPVSKPRAFAYLQAALTPSAVLTGAIGRVQVSLAGFNATAKAEISGRIHHVAARLVTAAQGLASIQVVSPAVRAIVRMAASASAAVAAKVWARGLVSATAQADMAVVVQPRFKAVVASVAAAVTEYVVTVRPRSYYRTPLNAALRAVSDLTPRALRRSVVGSTATATGAVQPRYLLRAPVDARAAADGRVDFNVIKRIPWDEPAPEGRVFKVSPETFTFMVT